MGLINLIKESKGVEFPKDKVISSNLKELITGMLKI
jgi:hypothetical protein